MEITWEKPISSASGHHRHPSFSSTLLDQIYRSIDDSSALDSIVSTRNKKQEQQHHHRQGSFYDELEVSPDYRRRSMADDFERFRRTTTTDSFSLRYSNSSSSDSSGFSSSDSGRSKSSASPPPLHPIRTSVDQKPPNNKQDLGGFLRKKSKALKIYNDLKKMKQPISPGGKLAAFLNSLFTSAATNPKKQKKTTTTTAPSSSTCSTASSFSRSCLSKTPTSSSSEKSKRSVRFCTVNVILDEDYSHYDVKHHRQNMEEENRRVIEAAKDLLRTFHNNKLDHLAVEEEEDDDEDDGASYASSDLFELENLSAIGEELPVYETTRVDTNRAIASGFIV